MVGGDLFALLVPLAAHSVSGLRRNTVQPVFDERWRKRALAGESAAISELARSAMTPLFRFCLYRVGRDEHLCEDVVQKE